MLEYNKEWEKEIVKMKKVEKKMLKENVFMNIHGRMPFVLSALVTASTVSFKIPFSISKSKKFEIGSISCSAFFKRIRRDSSVSVPRFFSRSS